MVLVKTHQLILKNDSEHDYLYVIACLMRVCDHTAEQAEQCTLITHNVGQCSIKTGDILQMMEMQDALTTLSLDVELDQYESNLYK